MASSGGGEAGNVYMKMVSLMVQTRQWISEVRDTA